MPLAAATGRSCRPSGPEGQRGRFRTLIGLSAQASGLTLEPENVEVDDGLGPPASAANDDGDGDGTAPRGGLHARSVSTS
jgi:hypothetical protein